MLSFLLFGSLLTIGQAVQFKRTFRNQPIVDKYQGKSFQLISLRTFFCLISLLFAELPFWLHYFLLPLVLFALFSEKTVGYIFPLSFIAPSVIIVLFARHRLHAAVSTILITTFFTIIALTQLMNLNAGSAATYSAVSISMVLPLILLSVAPAKAISRRLIFLAIGLILLIALNELSKLGLDVTAPRLQG